MIQINDLQILNFRNLQSVKIKPCTGFNIFYGKNGAGKSSILEAIYYFGFGRSFRSNVSARLIREKSDHFSLFSELKLNHNATHIGIEKDISGVRRIRYNGSNISSISPVAKLLPIQLINTDSYRFFHEGPKLRRQFLNWGLFHVEPSFYSLWQQLLHLLKQRNALLKARRPSAELAVWNVDLINLSEKIDKLRKNYVNQLRAPLEKFLSTLLGPFHFQVEYNPGWDASITFAEALNQNYRKDQAIGYTTVGPQRADLQLLANKGPAGEFLSQGEQKLASYALYLTQGQLLRKLSNKIPIYLIDDLPSELDPDKRSLITSVLADIDAQVFMTGITQLDLQDVIALENTQLFHVEHGNVSKI